MGMIVAKDREPLLVVVVAAAVGGGVLNLTITSHQSGKTGISNDFFREIYRPAKLII